MAKSHKPSKHTSPAADEPEEDAGSAGGYEYEGAEEEAPPEPEEALPEATHQDDPPAGETHQEAPGEAPAPILSEQTKAEMAAGAAAVAAATEAAAKYAAEHPPEPEPQNEVAMGPGTGAEPPAATGFKEKWPGEGTEGRG